MPRLSFKSELYMISVCCLVFSSLSCCFNIKGMNSRYNTRKREPKAIPMEERISPVCALEFVFFPFLRTRTAKIMPNAPNGNAIPHKPTVTESSPQTKDAMAKA